MRTVKFKFYNKKLRKMSWPLGLGIIYETLVDEWGIFDWKDVEKLQFTGIKDVNGVEIYEGDVVVALVHSPFECNKKATHPAIRTVIFQNGAFRLQDGAFISHDPIGSFVAEVIGNIYESKHLLDNTDTKE